MFNYEKEIYLSFTVLIMMKSLKKLIIENIEHIRPDFILKIF